MGVPGEGWGLKGLPTFGEDTVLREERDFLLRRGLGSHLSAAGVVGVSGAGRGLLGPRGAEMLVEPERGGSGGFSSSPSVDRGQWAAV